MVVVSVQLLDLLLDLSLDLLPDLSLDLLQELLLPCQQPDLQPDRLPQQHDDQWLQEPDLEPVHFVSMTTQTSGFHLVETIQMPVLQYQQQLQLCQQPLQHLPTSMNHYPQQHQPYLPISTNHHHQQSQPSLLPQQHLSPVKCCADTRATSQFVPYLVTSSTMTVSVNATAMNTETVRMPVHVTLQHQPHLQHQHGEHVIIVMLKRVTQSVWMMNKLTKMNALPDARATPNSALTHVPATSKVIKVGKINVVDVDKHDTVEERDRMTSLPVAILSRVYYVLGHYLSMSSLLLLLLFCVVLFKEK